MSPNGRKSVLHICTCGSLTTPYNRVEHPDDNGVKKRSLKKWTFLLTAKNFPRLPNGKIMPARMIKSRHHCRFSWSRRKGRQKTAWKNAGRTVKNQLIPLHGAFNNQRFSPTRIKTQLSRGPKAGDIKKGSRYTNLLPFFMAQLCLNS